MQTTPALGAFAEPATAAAHFRALLAHAADVSDVAAALARDGDPGFVLVDTRSEDAWTQGRIPGARHLPTAVLATGAHGLDPGVPVVVHCWGPGCNGAQRAALVLAEQGFRVKELMGGFEYWAREGLAYETGTAPAVTRRDPADRLTAPLAADDCGC
ncbi:MULTISPECIES: rhodanese-like domain-containing protein [Streptomyces]|uniref:Rhodanese-like domain-containing protein n=1 Tax=Streptomyces evansiae TaxID=3075535 RepID=A0ABU2QX53_9ACTN|nr:MULTISPECIES: rhodanese-like domain-containing protein [unclassified Streptomyces]MDT0408424.1 rhodanese-like domain-containing protein [Streptomyces sp. DSM 41979]MYQ61764.1 rhodanese-like domain-containing protein [Streptomyces sp. SID4926]WEH26248.1 rhodanese-like domain-containing protein [Streptomyces sp. AM 3-1-1]SCE32811.1 Rhodanese-related sulfurtransferase [Streptomyces sp. DfronAA-171]